MYSTAAAATMLNTSSSSRSLRFSPSALFMNLPFLFLVFLAISPITFPSVSAAPRPALNDAPPPGERRRGCGVHIEQERVIESERMFKAHRLAPEPEGAETTLDINFFIIYANKTAQGGYIRTPQILEQVKVMNQDYSQTGFKWKLVNITRMENEKWFHELADGSPEEHEMKTRYRQGGPSTLNVYTVGFTVGPPILGYASFPMDYASNPKQDGIVLLHTTLPAMYSENAPSKSQSQPLTPRGDEDEDEEAYEDDSHSDSELDSDPSQTHSQDSVHDHQVSLSTTSSGSSSSPATTLSPSSTLTGSGSNGAKSNVGTTGPGGDPPLGTEATEAPPNNFNLGRTLVHEAGHWLGLYHIFQGGCKGAGDEVDDTPPQESAAFGCPTKRDSCPGGGPDQLDNFMGYTDDRCMNKFTPGQATRMKNHGKVFRGIKYTVPQSQD